MNAYRDETLQAHDEIGSGLLPWQRFAVGLAALLAVGAAIWGFFQVTGMQPVAQLQIEGRLQRVDVMQIDAALRPLLEASFIGVDLQAVQDAAAAQPWVAVARAERHWPATVRVRLWERQPAARWGSEGLLDVNAVPFDPAGRELPPGLPVLSGPTGSASQVLGTYRQLSSRLDGSVFELAGLTQDARGDWVAMTQTDVELRFGRSDPLQAVETLLGPAQRALADQFAGVAHIDLRYTNGFSVGWRSAPPTAAKRTS
ncbi:cell division protein FtsQ/DivIB [Sinimarinibacterium sp. NLF-5-8]|uniref:cell division protein FtsQ/DivIB n=1 Tax=Sinimarinibacterium sp. NLF-5-8 TaxID=2698684 RepID=UPI00137BA9B7|nr:cell division protein FtsQ/DivIB [Sinimarinibacterium sp. NLF-5-8]QHS10258.1 FtsQ-type POTRA domain-containing protein [Sinimarinibacterium sp. NLF-5-8]